MKSVTCDAMGLLAAILGAGASAQPPAKAAFAGGFWYGRAPGGCLASAMSGDIPAGGPPGG